jgi:outer membrane protein OmpA-like peptidoglycan-associated protein
MTNTSKRLLILALWVLYVLLVLWVLYPAASSGGVPANLDTDETETANTYPLASSWDTAGIFEGPGARREIRRVRSGQGENKILEITGLYYEGEDPGPAFESMGLARAASIRDQYFQDLPADQIKLLSLPMRADSNARTGYFSAARFSWIQPEETVKEDVEELEDRILIRFPFNSTEKVYNPVVDEYLQALADTLVRTGETVQLTGHTDNIGGEEFNLTLGQQRADAIQAILRRYGVPSSQITTISKGKSLPVDSNQSEEGRQNNRRVEVVRIRTNQ